MTNLSLFFSNNALMPFHLSVVILGLISLIQTIGFYFGIRPLAFLKYFIPIGFNSPLLHIKFSKILILIFFLINFSFVGYFLQFFFYAYDDGFASISYILIPTFIIAVFFTVFMIHCLDQVIRPKYTYRPLNLIGRLATISGGSIRPEHPAQARVRDEYGQLHYVYVVSEAGEIPINTQIILIRMKGHNYVAKKIAPSNHLFDYEIFPECQQEK
ncbi:OB-fold-containig protein [Acinetobacter sp. HY1485]|uniref:OB-fold-containig protein n=1 Tax=Acinetobacter sp. HY1485 TaxID=2970918 RepID=UPI0022B99E77|nr:OB-fold-containig protein [Acinetobacter sp. HY1485]